MFNMFPACHTNRLIPFNIVNRALRIHARNTITKHPTWSVDKALTAVGRPLTSVFKWFSNSLYAVHQKVSLWLPNH